MSLAFVLRFQEPCDLSTSEVPHTGTETMTKIEKESSDPGMSGCTHFAIPNLRLSTGTITTTRMMTEQGDSDRSATRAIPKRLIMGTKTITAVQMEMADQDHRQREFSTFPRCL